MTIGEIIGKNLYEYRTKLGYTQDHIASFLGIERSLISKYENNEREISMIFLNKLSDLFGIELDDLIEENSVNKAANLAFAFRSEGIDETDMNSIAGFQKVVKNYLKMKDILINE
jgi:transcriptional regulator with XRE-family HTH domain